ncbi:MAG: AMP-binding protein [Syntrophales bacterium]|nr:AMP-binding protein [Syntrophales bacterium]
MAVFERFTETVGLFPELIFLQMKEETCLRSLTFGEVYERAKTIGRYLINTGINRGDRVAIFAENTPEWCIAYLGIVSIGAVAVPLDVQYGRDEVENLLRDSESRVVFTSKNLLSLLNDAAKGLKIRIISLDTPIPDSPPAEFPMVSDDDLASLLYTSGTTGIPKGVMLTHENLLSNADALLKPGVVSHNDHVLSILPLHHAYPFMVCFLMPSLVGGRVTFLNSLKGPEIMKTMREEGVTILVGVPQLYFLIRKGIMTGIESLPGWKRLITRLMFTVARGVRRGTGFNVGRVVFKKVHREFGTRLRFFTSGGARLDPAVASDMEVLGFTILEGYGLTETSPVVTFNLPGAKRIGSAGRAVGGVEVRIDNPDVSGVGEVVIRGPNVMRGYYKNPAATAEVVREGWFHSGDLGCLDPDGFLFITGRTKEVIVLSSGKNIYPEDVENHYLQSPYIKEVCIAGIPDPSHPGSFVGIKSLIFPDFEKISADGIANITEAIRWQIEKLSATLPPYSRATDFGILKEPLPRTHLGKIKRFIVGEVASAAATEELPLSDEEQRLIESDVGKVVLQALSFITERRVSPRSHLEMDLGIDSLGRVELMVALENGLGVAIPPSFPSEVTTVKDVILRAIEYTGGAVEIESLKKPVSWSEILRQSPPDDMMDRIKLKSGVISNAILHLVLWFVYLAARVFLRLEVRGRENIPAEGACIIAPNHASYLDGFIVGAALRERLTKLYAVGFRGYFRGAMTSRLARWGHIITIDANSGLSESLQVSAYVLKEDMALIVFPEGGRSVDGRIMPFKKGVGILAGELKVPLIPTYIEGSVDILPRGAWLPRLKKVRITFEAPLTPDDMGGLDYQGIADRLRESVISLQRIGLSG